MVLLNGASDDECFRFFCVQWEVIVKIGGANALTNIPLQNVGDRPHSGSELSDVGSDAEGLPLRGED